MAISITFRAPPPTATAPGYVMDPVTNTMHIAPPTSAPVQVTAPPPPVAPANASKTIFGMSYPEAGLLGLGLAGLTYLVRKHL